VIRAGAESGPRNNPQPRAGCCWVAVVLEALKVVPEIVELGPERFDELAGLQRVQEFLSTVEEIEGLTGLPFPDVVGRATCEAVSGGTVTAAGTPSPVGGSDARGGNAGAPAHERRTRRAAGGPAQVSFVKSKSFLGSSRGPVPGSRGVFLD
jgi:hypothetical protein